MNQHNQSQFPQMPTIYAVVLNWNGYEDTAKCLASLRHATFSNLKIVLVDNGSTDGSAELLEHAFPEKVMLKLPHNGGYAAGNNAGIRFALDNGADYVLVLNNDVVVEKNFIQPMLELFGREPSAGLVTCKVYYESEPERIYAAGGSFSRWLCTGVNDRQGKLDSATNHLKDDEHEITFVPGCLFLARREVFEKIGMMDEKFFLYFEDLDFSRRVQSRFRLYYTPSGKVYHKSGAGLNWASYTPTYYYYHTRNRLWAFEEDTLFYRVYVFLFTLLNATAKTITLLLHAHRGNRVREPRTRQKVFALWRGVMDGIRRNGMEPTGR